MHSRTLALVLLAGLAIAPSVTAWGTQGAWEPDTSNDRLDGWMYPVPDTSSTATNPPVRKVYFNAFAGVYPLQPVNTNLATAQTAIHWQDYRTYAALGVWKDCNKDGYMGLGDQGLLEYKAELLLDTSVCKRENIPLNQRGAIPFNWFPVHNDGQWIHEYIPIMWNRADAENVLVGEANPFNINSNGTRIWGDFTRLEQPAGASCGGNPQPTGTYHSTGGLVWFADCHADYRATDTWNLAIATIGGDDYGLGQLSFKDKPRDQHSSASVLNQRNPWGEEGDASYAKVWDCSQPRIVVATPREAGGTHVTNVSRPGVPTASTTGSPAGTANATASGFDECQRTSNNNGETHVGQSAATVPYANEGGSTATTYKSNPEDWMAPLESTRPAAPFGTLLGRGTPANFGVSQVDTIVGLTVDGFWMGRTNWAGGPLYGYTTFYAYVSPSTITQHSLTLPKGSVTGVYGAKACESGIGPGQRQNGWECDPAKWFLDATGADVEPRSGYLGQDPSRRQFGCDAITDGLGCYAYGTRVGSAYNMRDVDCYDTSAMGLRQAGVHWGTVEGEACSW